MYKVIKESKLGKVLLVLLIIGVGNAGLKIADGLARSGKVDELILSDLSPNTIIGILSNRQ